MAWAGDITGNGISKLFLTIAAAFAEAERDRIRERMDRRRLTRRRGGAFSAEMHPLVSRWALTAR